jgi:hypothetical protein
MGAGRDGPCPHPDTAPARGGSLGVKSSPGVNPNLELDDSAARI